MSNKWGGSPKNHQIIKFSVIQIILSITVFHRKLRLIVKTVWLSTRINFGCSEVIYLQISAWGTDVGANVMIFDKLMNILIFSYFRSGHTYQQCETLDICPIFTNLHSLFLSTEIQTYFNDQFQRLLSHTVCVRTYDKFETSVVSK